jgi:DNA-binding response OmpR family regulator
VLLSFGLSSSSSEVSLLARHCLAWAQKTRKRCYRRSTAGEVLEFRILGPIEVAAGGQPVALGGMKARALLAFLLLHRNELVVRERLVDELWGERPPRAVAAELRVYVAKLRKGAGP